MDTIYGNEANDIIIGGAFGDTIHGNSGFDLIIGDNGRLDGVDSSTGLVLVVGTIKTTDTTSLTGGVDTITGDEHDDIILGGLAGDTLSGNDADDVVVGDNGELTDTVYNADGMWTIGLITSEIVTSENSDQISLGGRDTIHGDNHNDILIGGADQDTIFGDANFDIILGDNGRLTGVDSAAGPMPGDSLLAVARIETIDTSEATGGDDTIEGNRDDDIILGGLGQDRISGNQDDDVILGDNGILLNIIFDHLSLYSIGNISTSLDGLGGADTARGNDGDDVIFGGTGDDRLDGNSESDLILGDNGILTLRDPISNITQARFRVLTGDVIYGEDAENDGLALIDFAQQFNNPDGNPKWAIWEIELNNTLSAGTFGDDYIAGGSEDDTIFGQRGDDVIQGDSSIDLINDVGAYRDDTSGLLVVSASVEITTDGDDYIEGNTGEDVLFGNLGQDDIIGGSSEHFGLTESQHRADGSDLIFGGAGISENLTRNSLGDDGINEGHARDADTLLGDNGNIYRLVGTQSTTQDSYLTFNYDNYSPVLKLVPRAVVQLDYTPGGLDHDQSAGSDIGAADEIHGEAGDDMVYGMVGDDVLFGEGQDDDLIGGYGFDWISGGTGQDGVLGDDGRIYTSRNSESGESLYGIGGFGPNELNKAIATAGGFQQAIINVEGALKKTVNLTPFNVAITADATDLGGNAVLFDAQFADDIIYGGWGSDFLHGGSGDDAISGAEALIEYYQSPDNSGNILGFGDAGREGEFAAYNEVDPRSRILVAENVDEVLVFSNDGDEFILNFDHEEGPDDGHSADTAFLPVPTDGDDVIFGDLGNDWLVGGTGRDNLYGGFGDDLMNADDNHDSNAANDIPDTHPSYEDRAYGGAGRDILIGNTGGDRLIDWSGEFNSYIVPFAPFGLATVSRALQPQIMDFLYDLSESDGVDPTRATDTDSDSARNGEPEGELGLVKQGDFGWGDQTGSPDDPQPGNVSGGARDVLRGAEASNGGGGGAKANTDTGGKGNTDAGGKGKGGR